MRSALAFAVMLACVLAVGACEDQRAHEARADLLERSSCRDTDWSRGYMVRRPGDPHGLEWCEQIARGAPARFSRPVLKEAAR